MSPSIAQNVSCEIFIAHSIAQTQMRQYYSIHKPVESGQHSHAWRE